jgi:hypothetical protein
MDIKALLASATSIVIFAAPASGDAADVKTPAPAVQRSVITSDADECGVYAAALAARASKGVVGEGVYTLLSTDRPDVDFLIRCDWRRLGLSLPHLIGPPPPQCVAADAAQKPLPKTCPDAPVYPVYLVLERPVITDRATRATLGVGQRGPQGYARQDRCSFVRQAGRWRQVECHTVMVT